jgi:hypothetical protein
MWTMSVDMQPGSETTSASTGDGAVIQALSSDVDVLQRVAENLRSPPQAIRATDRGFAATPDCSGFER